MDNFRDLITFLKNEFRVTAFAGFMVLERQLAIINNELAIHY